MRCTDRAVRARTASRPLASTTTRAAIERRTPSSERASTPTARPPSKTTLVTSHPSQTSAPHALAAAQEQLVELVARHLERVIPARRERVGERVARRAGVRPAGPLDEAGASLDHERVAHLLEDADGVQHADAPRQERLAQVKARMMLALEDDHAAAQRREARGAHGPSGAAADHRGVVDGHSAVLGGGPSWMRSPMYAPMSVRRMPMPAKIR